MPLSESQPVGQSPLGQQGGSEIVAEHVSSTGGSCIRINGRPDGSDIAVGCGDDITHASMGSQQMYQRTSSDHARDSKAELTLSYTQIESDIDSNTR